MQLSVYKRTPEGEISYLGHRLYDRESDFFKSIYGKASMPAEETQVLPKEWPDRLVTWRGMWGCAGGNSKLKLRQVNLTDEQVEIAKQIGSGNISEGIRVALEVFV